MNIPYQCITLDLTGHVLAFGTSDLSPQLQAGQTLVILPAPKHFKQGVPVKYHKVVANDFVEMNTAEKTAVDAWEKTRDEGRLKGSAALALQVANLAALPVPPPRVGCLVVVDDVGAAVAGLALSTATGYIVFSSTGVYP